MLYAKYLLKDGGDLSSAVEWAEKAKAIRGHSLEVRVGVVSEMIVLWLAPLQAQEILESARDARFPAWHFRMLNDRGRNSAYRSVIRTTIDKGCVLLKLNMRLINT